MQLPVNVRKILWDVSTNDVDLKKHRSFIIARITESGGWSEVSWLRKHYTLRDIKTVVQRSKNTSKKTKSFWKTL